MDNVEEVVHYGCRIVNNMVDKLCHFRGDSSEALDIQNKIKETLTEYCYEPVANFLQPKYYKVFIRQYSMVHNDTVVYVKYIKTNDIYSWIGHYMSASLEQVHRIDYLESDSQSFNDNINIIKTYRNGEEVK